MRFRYKAILQNESDGDGDGNGMGMGMEMVLTTAKFRVASGILIRMLSMFLFTITWHPRRDLSIELGMEMGMEMGMGW